MAERRTFTFRSRPEAVSAARKALDGFDAHLDAGVFYDASLCVSELVTNAVLHSDMAPDDELELDVTIDGSVLRVAVTGSAAGFVPPGPSLDDETGWGLFIVDRLASRWGVEHYGGTRVWFEIGAAAQLPLERPAEESSVARTEPAKAPAERVPRRSVGRIRPRPQTTA